jgi:hypothetical protein
VNHELIDIVAERYDAKSPPAIGSILLTGRYAAASRLACCELGAVRGNDILQ